MRWLRRHLDLLALERFAADEAEAEERRRAARHLSDCPRCRARLQWVRTLPGRLERATRPPLPEGVEERILARRSAGDRVILPVGEVEGNTGRTGRRAWTGAVAALLLLSVLGGLFFLLTPEADARWSELTFRPAAPGPGETVQVVYRPGPALEDEEWLALRGRLAGPVDYASPPPSPERLTVLHRSDGVFRGAFTLRPGTVYGQVAVEDSAGARVDDRGGRLWHLHVHESGRPVAEALRAHAHLSPNWEGRYEAIRRATRLYPHRPRLQAARLSRELESLSRSGRDSALAVHRARLAELEDRLSAREPLEPGELVGLVEYARTVGDSGMAREWTRRLVGRHPTHPEAVWYRVPSPPADGEVGAVRDYLGRLEALWREAGPHPAISAPGFWAARQLGDPAAVLRWAERDAEHPGWRQGDPGRVPLLLSEVPGVRPRALRALRLWIRRLDGPTNPERPLDRTVEEDRRDRREAMRPLLARLGDLLLEEGDRRAALDTLRVAASIGWSRSLHRRVAALELAVGDTAAAARSLARAAAPAFDRTGGEAGATLRIGTGEELVGRDRWELMRRTARDQMYRAILSRSVSRQPRLRPVYLFDGRGRRHTLEELGHRTVTVVAFWEPWSGPAVRDLPRLRRVAYLVAALGGSVLAITEEPPGERVARHFAEEEMGVRLYHDLDRRASAAFEQYGAPEYFVLDLDGRIRFADSDLDDVVAQVDALLNEPRLLAAGTRPEGRAPPRTARE